ncbi:hypothetical protein JHK86_000180 [Glycine max]|nr:hypothetical protein JHK86_000180 [Glycine max]
MYSVYSLWEFVKDIGEKKDSGLLNARILNQFSSSFSRLRKRKAGEMGKAVAMMRLRESTSFRPDVYTYIVLASAYSNGGRWKIMVSSKR